MNRKLLSKFQEYCKGKTIAIVGNSSCIFNKSHGSDIDSHDIVIRFNWTIDKPIHKWHANLGGKFNVYVYAIKSYSRILRYIKSGLLNDKDFIIRVRHDDAYKLPSLHASVKKDKNIKKILYYNQSEFKESLPVNWFNKKEPSAGAIILQFLIDCVDFKSISLYGFDFFETSTETPQESNEFQSFFYRAAHDKQAEKNFFNYWISEYKGTGKLNFYK